MNFDFATVLAAAAPPAGGAEIGQIVIATMAATIVTAALLYLGLGHRSGRVKILQRLADHAERTSGLPGSRSSSGSTVRKSKKPTDGRPQKPDIDDSLEPMKALLEKKIPAIVNTTRAPAIKEIVASFTERKLPYILQGARDAVDTPEILGDSDTGFLFTPEILNRKGMKVRNNAARIAEAGHPGALVSGDTEGARYLPLHAALAVRYGMDPTEALKAISLYPARMFKLDDRIGSLKRGKDASFR
jgi:hypothetical protein